MKNSVLVAFSMSLLTLVASSQAAKQQMSPQQQLINTLLVSGDFGAIKKAIKAGADINKPDKYGITPFMYAMPNTGLSKEAVDFLFAQSPKFALTDNNGLTAFDWAGLGFVKDSPQMQKLKKLKKNSSGKNPFIRALLEYAYASDKKSALAKLQKNVTPKNANLSMGQAGTILDFVFYYTTDTTPLDLLLTAGADVTAANVSGVTPLMAAVAASNEYAVSHLIPKSNLKATDTDGNTALMYTLSPYNLGTAAKRLQIANTLIDKGSDSNATNKQGLSVLMMAVIGGYLEIVKMLIKRGVTTSVMDNSGDSALAIATNTNAPSLAMVQALLGAEDIEKTINTPDQYGWTPLMYVVGNSTPAADTVKIVQALLQAGAKTVLPEVSGYGSALSMAVNAAGPANKQVTDIIKALLNAQDIREGINAPDDQNMTALEYAQVEGYPLPGIAAAIQKKMKQLGMLQE